MNGFGQSLRVDGEPFGSCSICMECSYDNNGKKYSRIVVTSNLSMDQLDAKGAIIVSQKNEVGRKIIEFLPNHGQKITFYAAHCQPLDVVVSEFVTGGAEYQMYIVGETNVVPAPVVNVVEPTPTSNITLPFTITSCTVSNIGDDGELPFDAAHSQYLKPEIKYTCYTAGSYDIYVKLYDADGDLSAGSSSPSGYTLVSNVSMNTGSNRKKLTAWGSDTPGYWRSGSYRYEFYYNGTLLYTHNFTIPEGQQSDYFSGSDISGGSSGDHEYVDLGLPSGTLWATCNIGASSPEEYGDYFAWGETTTKNNYVSETYKYRDEADMYIKYNSLSEYGRVDNKTTLEPSDDAATANWGSDWCMPTQKQFQELNDKCTWTWTTKNGKNGYEVKGPNGKSIFLPTAGITHGTTIVTDGSFGQYWSSSRKDRPWSPALFLFFKKDSVEPNSWTPRYFGHSVRPVRSK